MTSETGFDHRLYERFPTRDPRPEGELEDLERIWCAPKGWQLLSAVNNNYIGFFYVAAAFLFFLLAGILALGMRSSVMPGARVRSTPTMISIAPAMADISMKPMPSSQKSALIPGDHAVEVSGGYMNQPPSGARPTKIEQKKNSPPMKYAQKA